MSTIYCLVPQRDNSGHVINQRCPGYPASEIGYLRQAVIPATEGDGWVVLGRLGQVFQGRTAAAALEAFHEGNSRGGV